MQHVENSPITLHVSSGPTAAEKCEVKYSTSLVAGDMFTVELRSYDEHSNPTFHGDDKFTANSILLERNANDTFTFSTRITAAGTHIFSVLHNDEDSVEELVVQVGPAQPDLANCKHSLADDRTLDSSKGAHLKLQVAPFDEFKNPVLDSDNFTVAIDSALPVSLPWSNLYQLNLVIPKDTNQVLLITFAYKGYPLPGCPVSVSVSPARPVTTTDPMPVFVGGLGLAAMFFFVYSRQKKVGAKTRMELTLASTRLRAVESENDNLLDSLRGKKHSDAELAIMETTLAQLSADKKNELKGVMIDSAEIKLERLLGKGAFGSVHLASYKGGQIAVKQLNRVEDESVKRFR